MKNITIILPIHKWDEEHIIMFNNCVDSVKDFYNDVILHIVAPKEFAEKITIETDKLTYKVVVNDSDTNFCNQMNIGIDRCETERFSILEVDDEYRPCWLKSMSDYIKENPTVDVFLPIVRDIGVDGKFLSYTNEAVWAYGFASKQGFLDEESLLEYQNFQISGGLYRTNTIKEMGKFKENFKLTFGYEFLLRLTHNNIEIMCVPRVGYQHVNFRENSLFWEYKNSDKDKLSENEVKFWLETAKKEYFFKNKRDIIYVEN